MNIRKYMFQYYIIRALEILALCSAWGAFVCQTCLVSEGFLHWSVLAITGILTFFLTMYVPYKNIWLAFWHQEDELDKVVDKFLMQSQKKTRKTRFALVVAKKISNAH